MSDKAVAEHDGSEDAPDSKSGRDATQPNEATKTQDLAKAGRDDLDPNAGQEQLQPW